MKNAAATATPPVTRRQAIVAMSLLTGAALPLARAAQAAGPTAAKAGAMPVSVPEYELLARDRMSHAAWEYIMSGCADDVTLQWNRDALTRLRLDPRVLVDVSRIDTSIRLLGREWPHPILLAPTATHMLAHPEGEHETARGAAAAKAILVASMTSNHGIEAIARQAPGPVWFQLYVQRDQAMTRDLVQRAEAAGVQALCITVDQPVIYARDRVARAGKAGTEFPLGNLPGARGATKEQPGPVRSRALSWKDLDWFRSFAKTPIILKGILRADDAEEAVKQGVAGIIVSNHGGRALDSVPATIEALPRVVEQVGGRIPVLMDGGIRRGTDILKALALGANAVLIGRPYLFGLAVNGAEGVRHVVEILRTELEAAMALTGRTSIAAIDRSVLWKP